MPITPLNKVHNNDAKKYKANPDHLDKIEELLTYAYSNMTSPCVYHLLSHIEDPSAFNKASFIKNFKAALKRQYKGRGQKEPEVLVIHSVEFKMTDIEEIDDTGEAFSSGKDTRQKLPFLHLHVCIIADCKRTIPQSFNEKASKALNEIAGLSKARYFKSKKRKVLVLNEEKGLREHKTIKPKMYKKLKDEFDDVYDRVKYLAKIEQKKDVTNIPFRQKFGCSRLPKVIAKT